MAIRDLFFPLLSYPDPTPEFSIQAVIDISEKIAERCCARDKNGVSADAKTRIFALIIETLIDPGLAIEGGVYIEEYLNVEAKKCTENARHLSDQFEVLIRGRRILGTCKIIKNGISASLRAILCESRLHDMTAISIAKDNDFHQTLAEQLIFESGRPVLIFPEAPNHSLDRSFGKIAVAWDGSRPAARALADAMPFLRRADRVRIFSVTDDKNIDLTRGGIGIADALNADGVYTVFEEVNKHGVRDIGAFIEDYVTEHEADLLVMGAYGHSRFREFFLGSATSSILAHPPGWVMMSH